MMLAPAMAIFTAVPPMAALALAGLAAADALARTMDDAPLLLCRDAGAGAFPQAESSKVEPRSNQTGTRFTGLFSGMPSDYSSWMMRFLEELGSSATLVKGPADSTLPRNYRVLMGAAALLIGVGFATLLIATLI